MIKQRKEFAVFIVSCVLVLAIIVGAAINLLYSATSGLNKYEIESFWEYKEHFQILATKFRWYYESNARDSGIDCLTVAVNSSGKWTIRYYVGGKACHNSIEYTPTIAEINAFEYCFGALNEKVKDNTGEAVPTIRVDSKQVVFISKAYENYAVIFTKSWHSPSYLMSKDEKHDIYVERLGLHWFEAVNF